MVNNSLFPGRLHEQQHQPNETQSYGLKMAQTEHQTYQIDQNHGRFLLQTEKFQKQKTQRKAQKDRSEKEKRKIAEKCCKTKPKSKYNFQKYPKNNQILQIRKENKSRNGFSENG